MKLGLWDADGLAGLKVPSFFVSGSLDDVSGHETGTKAIYNGAMNTASTISTSIL